MSTTRTPVEHKPQQSAHGAVKARPLAKAKNAAPPVSAVQR